MNTPINKTTLTLKRFFKKSVFSSSVIIISSLALNSATAGPWTIEDISNEDLPGRSIEIQYNGQRVAGLVYGEGQFKPYLAVYDSQGRRITNPGLDADGNRTGRFPHHRGIFIGWNHIDSNLGRDDLWHMTGGTSMQLSSVERKETHADSATIEVLIPWISKNRTDELQGKLIGERRTITVSRPDGRTRIDQRSELTAVRDLELGGDLQHAGLHFRAAAEVDEVRDQTRYLFAPANLPAGNGRIISDKLQWVNFRFPLFDQWYSVTQLNVPANRASELSWRDYGRFGFFFQDQLKRGDTRVMEASFIISEAPDSGEDAAVRARADSDFANQMHAGNLLEVAVAGEPRIYYQAAPLKNPIGGDRFQGSNFIHPLKTPAGFVVTHIQPLDHLHHFGMWWPWKYVRRDGRQVLFWELQRGQGIIQATDAQKTADGFVAESVYIDRRANGGPQEWMRENLSATVSTLVDAPAPGYHLDLNIKQQVLGDEPLEIVSYRYSGFTLRGTQEWNRHNSRVLTSEGMDYSQANATRARWVLVQGSNGETGAAGILMMSHPNNQNHPEHLRTWNPNTHNGAIFINFNPVQQQSFTIHPAEPHTRRYRIFVFDGQLSAQAAEQLWQEYVSLEQSE